MLTCMGSVMVFETGVHDFKGDPLAWHVSSEIKLMDGLPSCCDLLQLSERVKNIIKGKSTVMHVQGPPVKISTQLQVA